MITPTYRYFSTLELLDKVKTNIRTRKSTPEIPTGLSSLDDLIWGLHKKELLIIAARPSHGKTSLALQIARNVSRTGKSCVFLSLEMSAESVLERLFCSEAGLHGWKLRKGDLFEIQRMEEKLSDIESALFISPIEIIDSMGFTIEQIEQILSDFKPEVLMIDHAQKISRKGFTSKYEALANYVNMLQSLAIKYNVAIVLNSQINRQGSKDQNAMDFLKGAGDLEECADTLIQCKWTWRDNREYQDRQEFVIDVIKQKHGPCDKIIVNFDGACFKFSDRSEKIIVDTFPKKMYDEPKIRKDIE